MPRIARKDDVLRRRTHKWTTAQRRFLLFVKRICANSWDDVVLIFNNAFSSEIKRSGLLNDRIRKSSLKAQYNELLLYQKTEYQIIHEQSTLQDLEKKFPEHNRMLQSAASDVMFQLEYYHEDPSRLPEFEKRRADIGLRRALLTSSADSELLKTTKDKSESSGADFSTDTASESDQESVVPRRKPLANQYLVTPPLTPQVPRSVIPHTTHKEELVAGHPAHDGVPFLLFRVFDVLSHGINQESGFVAGLFMEKELENTKPPHPDSVEFLRHAENHLDFESNQPSPLISFTSSLVWAMKRATERAVKSQHPVSIAVVDGRIASGATRMYHVQHQCQRVLKSGRTKLNRYKGLMEFWIWKRVEEQAVIGCFRLSELHDLAIKYPELERLLHLGEFHRHRSTKSLLRTFKHRRLDTGDAVAIASLLKLMKPNITYNHFLTRDMLRVIIQNFALSNDLNVWQREEDFMKALEAELDGESGIRVMQKFLCVAIPTIHTQLSRTKTQIPVVQSDDAINGRCDVRESPGEEEQVISDTGQLGANDQMRWLFSPYE